MSDQHPTRRDFIKNSGVTLGAATAFAIGTSAQAQSHDTLKVGLIGCGGRGSGAAMQAIAADPDTVLFALGDAFMDQVDGALKKFQESKFGDRVKVDEGHKFAGFDAYKHVVDSCDVVVLCATPAFRPKHLAYAVEQGKHVFCEKPIAVDPAGVRSVLETCEKAKAKGLSIVSGLCYRYQFSKQDVIGQIHDGKIGDILTMQTTYNTGTLWHKGRRDDWTEMEYQVRNWLYFDWLSGDHINEQHIHSLDKVAWAMGDVYPDKVTSSGGRVQRVDEKWGNIYDHFNSVYEWNSGQKAFSSCRQWADSSTDVSDYIVGTEGTAELQSHTIKFRNGDTWKHQQTGPDDMYQNEHNELFKAIRAGKPINNGEYMCGSTLMAIMARMSAYTGQTITREQALNSKLVLGPEKHEFGDVTANPVAIPGVTKFV